MRHTILSRRPALASTCAPLLALLLSCPLARANEVAKTPPESASQPQKATTAPGHNPQNSQIVAANQHAQQVQDIINRAEAAYKSGVSNYNSNNLDHARADFDSAVDILLSSPLDLKSDPALSDEFERLVSAINSLELDALKQGNGFSPKVEAAPLDAALNEVTFPANPALVGKLAEELRTTQSDFPLVVNDYVAGWISYFSNSPAGHAHLKRSLERAGKYKEMILRVLRENGVPQDLIYQAVAESGFQPQALNHSSGAGGMWQFMPFGGYGLQRNGYFDERFDPEKSTLAYARYMKSLYNQFGDWYLAMAAYDWGPGNVQRVVSRTGYADFWELTRHGVLPGETKAYVPGILAAIIMAKNPQQYGLTDLVPDAPVLSDNVNIDYAIDLRLVADLTGSTVSDIVALNPALLRLVTPRDISYDLHLPAGTRDTYLERLKDIPEDKRASWRFHVVKPGETVEAIATQFHSSTVEIASYNQLSPAQPLQAEDEVVIPIAAVTSSGLGQQRYKLRRGDTLVTVADRFGVSVQQLRAWNGAHAAHLRPGTSIYVAEPVRLAPGSRGTRSRRGNGAHGRASSGKGSRTRSASSHSTSTRHNGASSTKAKSSSKAKSKRSKK